MTHENPCLTCGACCAFFRVSFYWGETDDNPGGTVPLELTEDITPFYRAMRGTNQKNPRCTALGGKVGESASCSIYNQRPTPCRDFGVHFVDGKLLANSEELERCNHARAHYGLEPLTVDVWLNADGTPIAPAVPPIESPWPVEAPLPTGVKRRKRRRTPQRPPDGQGIPPIP